MELQQHHRNKVTFFSLHLSTRSHRFLYKPTQRFAATSLPFLLSSKSENVHRGIFFKEGRSTYVPGILENVNAHTHQIARGGSSAATKNNNKWWLAAKRVTFTKCAC
jgi:hypothetical protein